MLKVKKITLVFITGIIWILVGLMLIKRALSWFPDFTVMQDIITVTAGLILAYIKTRLIFIKVTHENIHRIMNMKNNKVSVFAFHNLKFYILIVLMIGFGTLLRNLEFIPKFTIFPIYAGIGLAMFYASFLYYKYFFKNK